MTQTFSRKGAVFLRQLEGVVLHYYLDASTPPVGTIGEGFTWRSAAFREWWKKNKRGMKFGPGATMTREECDDALIYIMAREYGKAVVDFFGKDVPQHVFDGFCSAVYNLGPGSLKWKWAQAGKRGDYAAAAERLRSTGTTAGGRELKGLVKRRIEEAELIEHGDYAIGGSQLPKAGKVPDGILERGERGPEVRELQVSLQTLDFYDGALDGIFGLGTEAAVVEYQRAHNLTVDGKAGPETLGNLNAGSPTPPKDYAPPEPPEGREGGIWSAIIGAILSLFKKG